MIGVFAVLIYLYFSKKKYSLENDDIFHLFLYGIIGAIIGSKVFFLVSLFPKIMIHYQVILDHPFEFVSFLRNGMVFYGGLLGGMVMIYRYMKKFNIDKNQATALLTPAIPLFHAFGRMGCFFAGCCGGRLFIPVQIIESLFNVILFVLLLIYQKKNKESTQVLEIYLLSYGIFRFVIEFFREDLIRGVYWLSTSQWISLVIVLAVMVKKALQVKNRVY